MPAPYRLNPCDTDVGAYTLVHASAGVRGRLVGRDVGRDVGLDPRARNLLNEAYSDFLSRYKRFALSPGRDIVMRVRVGL